MMHTLAKRGFAVAIFVIWTTPSPTTSTTQSAPSTIILPDFPPPDCRTSPVDILLLHDDASSRLQQTASSDGGNSLPHLEDFSAFAAQFGGDPLEFPRVQIAWASYGSQVTVYSNFSSLSPREISLKTKHFDSDVKVGVSDVGDALRFVLDTAFSGRGFGSREDAHHVVLMVAHSLPNTNVEDADLQISRLHKSGVKLFLLHFNDLNEKIDVANPRGLPFKNAIYLRNERMYSDIMRDGIAKLLCFPSEESKLLGMDDLLRYNVYHIRDIPFDCPSSSNGAILETFDQMIAVEKHIFNKLHGILLLQHNMPGLGNASIIFKLNLKHRFGRSGDSVWQWPTGKPKIPNTTPEGQDRRPADMMWSPLVYDNWDPNHNHTGECAVWYFPSMQSLSSAVSSGDMSIEDKYRRWKDISGGSAFQARLCSDSHFKEDCYNAEATLCVSTTDYVLCEIPDKQFKYQPMALPKTERSNAVGQMARRHFILLKHKARHDFRLESISNILASNNNFRLEWAIEEFPTTTSFVDIHSIPRYTCHMGPRRQYIPYSWVSHPKLGCQQWELGSSHVLQIPQYKQTYSSCAESPPCVLCMDQNSTVTSAYNFGNDNNSSSKTWCETTPCPAGGYVKCPDTSYCIPITFLRDVYQDCPGGEDEVVDLHQVSSSLPRHRQYDCPSYSYLTGYEDGAEMQYFPGEVDASKVRDGVIDCPFAEDELLAPTLVSYNFRCMTDPQRQESIKVRYVDPARLCDGVEDCPYGDDEVGCDVTCPAGLVCVAGTVRVRDLSRIPTDFSDDMIDFRIRYLDLSGLKMADLTNLTRTFKLVNVVFLKLSGCGIQSLRSHDGENHFRSIEHLDLSENMLNPFSEGYAGFDFWIRGALTLNISYNSEFTFFNFFDRSKRMKKDFAVKILDLSYTAISLKDRMVFSNFPSLEKLYLRGCPISNIKLLLPPNLLTVDLRGLDMDQFSPGVFSHLQWLRHVHVTSSKICCEKVIGELLADQTCSGDQDDVISSCDNLIKEATLRMMVWLVGLVACLGNAASIVYRLVWNRQDLQQQGHGLFVFNLSTADMLMGVNLVIVGVADVLYRGDYVLHDAAWRHGELCKVCGCLAVLSSEASVMFILCVTLDRFLAIKYPLGPVRLSPFAAKVMCGGVWIVCIFVSFFPLLPSLSHWEVYSASSVCTGLPLTKEKFPGWEYSMLIFVGLNSTLFILIVFGQLTIYKAVAASSKVMSGTMSEVQAQKRFRNDMRVARKLFLIVITDFMCWFPIGVMGIMSLTGKQISKEAYTWSTVILLPINSAVNPILYTLPVVEAKWNHLKTKLFSVKTNSCSNGTYNTETFSL